MELDINIDELVQLKTDKFIENANYTSLRQSCLDSTQSPVTEEIGQQLDGALVREKEKSKAAFTTEACSNQVQQDAQETQQDNQEHHRDGIAERALNTELAAVTPQIAQHALEIIRVNSLITHIQHDLDRVNQQIHEHNHALTHQHSHEQATHQHGHEQATHQHGHEQATHQHGHEQATHQHGHGQATHQHGHGQATHQHGHGQATHQHAQISLLQTQQRSILEGLRIQKQDLDVIQRAHAQVFGRSKDIKSELHQLKIKADARIERTQLRLNRQAARLSGSDVQHQLSTHNYRSLTTAITQFYSELETKKNGLMHTVYRAGYLTYLDRLTNYLQSQQTKLPFHEVEALKQIIRHMQDHLQKKSDEQCEISRLNTEQGKKVALEKGLHTNQAQLARLKQSNPELTAQNKQLEARNQQLMLDAKKQQELKNTTLKGSGISFAASATAAIGGILTLYFVPTAINLILLFAPAVGIAAVTVGFLIAALVYTLQHRSSKGQLQTNNDTIARNSKTIDSQSGTIKNLENVVIPDFQSKIKQAEATIAHIRAAVKHHGETAALHLDSAKKVGLIMASASNSSVFLSAPAPDVLPPAYTALPSAPEEEHYVADETVPGAAP